MSNTSSSSPKRRHKGRYVSFVVLVAVLALLFFLCRSCLDYMRVNSQAAAFMSLSTAIELSSHKLGGYPPSDALDEVDQPYCGIMKLTEALLGQDLLGFHPSSTFRLDGTDPTTGERLYATAPESLAARQEPYLEVVHGIAYRLADVYGRGRTGPFAEHVYVLCDVFQRERPSGAKTGMPILYYRADTLNTAHDVNDPNNPDNIYDYRDNHALVCLGVPGRAATVHPLADPKRFYALTRNHRVTSTSRPYKPDTYILVSAGRDGLYGTDDDIYNFFPEP